MSDHTTTGFSPLRPDDPQTVGGMRVVGRIGTGGMGTVYAGVGRRGRYTAIKVIREELTEDPGLRERFTREIRLLGRVESRCVPALLGSGRDGGVPWLVTEFVPGLSLSAHVREHGPLPPNLLRGLAGGVAEALVAAHTAGIVHRDLKPGNVVLAPDGPKVLDFGIARAIDETALTRTGGLVGTPGWIAPEVLRGAPATPAADLFGWGALVAFAATGRPPFGAGSTDSLAHRVLDRAPDLAGVPEALVPLVTAALDKDPAHRPTAAWLAATLTGHPGGEGLSDAVGALLDREWAGVQAESPTPPARGGRKVLLAAGATVLVLGAAGGGLLAARALTDEESEAAEGAGTAQGAETGQATEVDGEGSSGEPGWEPPAPTPFGTNAEWEAQTFVSPDGYTTFQATPDRFETLTYVSVTSVEDTADGVRFSVSVLNLVEGHDVPAMLTVTTPTAPLAPLESPGPVEIGDELDLTFPDAPDQGQLTFSDADHDPGVSGFPPVSLCYDAPAGTLSPDAQDCA